MSFIIFFFYLIIETSVPNPKVILTILEWKIHAATVPGQHVRQVTYVVPTQPLRRVQLYEEFLYKIIF